MRHKGYSHLLCYVFRVLSAIDIRENKERVYPQNPHDFRVVNTPIPVNINSRSADRPHVGTDPVSVRLTSVLQTEAILLVERYERLRIRRYVCHLFPNHIPSLTPSPLATMTNNVITK